MGPSFIDLRSTLFEAYGAGSYEQALAVADAAHDAFPDWHVDTWYWRACLLSLLGRTGEAIAALTSGLAEGAWWSARSLDGDSDFDALRPLPEFGRIKAECEARQGRAEAHSRPEVLVISPAAALWEPRSVLFVHKRRETARGFAQKLQPLVDEGWTLVVPQSSQPCDSRSFCWDDRALALREVRHHLEDCRMKRGLPLEGMVIAGASQGAPIAVDVACEAGLPWLCVIPSFPGDYDLSRLLAVPGHTRGAMILGENDAANARSRSVAGMLASGGVTVSVRTVAGIGHDISAPMMGEAAAALRELAGQAISEDG